MARTLRETTPFHRTLRRALGLTPEAPNPSGMITVAHREGGSEAIGLQLDFLPEEERAKEKQRWHEEGWRGEMASRISRYKYLPRRLHDKIGFVEDRYSAYRAEHLLKNARSLHFTSHYLHNPHGEQGVEGYFDFGGEITYSLTVYARSAMDKYASFEWERGDIVTSDNSLVFGNYERWLVVDADELNEDNIREGILRWYQDKFDFVRGHWSQVEGKLPELTLSLGWGTPEDFTEEAAEAVS